jgi:hypothetical protein
METNQWVDRLAAGAWLGFLVLVRLETVVFAFALAVALLAGRERKLCLGLVAGASWAAVAWAAYNWRVSGSPVSFEILRGDINVLRFDLAYIWRCLIHPASGLLFWSPLVCAGLFGLLTTKAAGLRYLGIASLPLIALWTLRIPVMLIHPPGTPLEAGGIPLALPDEAAGAFGLIRSDINRYATVLAPFAVIGLRDLIARVVARRALRRRQRRGR